MNARALTQAGQVRLQAGGTLNPRQHLYIERPEDQTLLQLLSERQYVNVLTSRQMGKSSLMVRAAEVLTKRGANCAIVDLAAELGTPHDATAYFLGLLNKIARDLRLELDLPTWWAERAGETMNQRLMRFFREVVLEQVQGPVVCFLDEIDSTLKLPWTDDLFTALRGIHNERPLLAAYERLTFCLIGVAWPNELIKHRRTTPYNVGRTLELRDFDVERNDLTSLAAALRSDPEQGRRLVERVLHWTGGHPYLTIRLCTSLVEIGAKTPEDVNRRVDESFRSVERVSGDVHFQQVLRFLETRLADGLATFSLYERVVKGARERDQPTLTHTELKLSGLVKRDEEGCLVVRNRIYERVFDRRWVESTKPRRALKAYRRYAIAASVALLMVGGTAAALITWLGSELKERERILAPADLEIVDCLLPPPIRRLGTQLTYLAPRRPIRTTGRDCSIRGGDAVVFDPSNYATALAIWLPLAEEGYPQAQTYVGDIYERGLAGSPDYKLAAEWYRRAADQGYASAQISLGQLYERGLGVTQDSVKAMTLYRQASSLGEPLEIVAAAELRLRQELDTALAEQRTLQAERESLAGSQKELLEQLRAIEPAETGRDPEKIARVEGIRQQLEQLARREAALSQREQEIAKKEAEPERKEEEINSSRPQEDVDVVGSSISPAAFGNYHALVIGNTEYRADLTSLASAALDAEAIAAMLKEQYRYDVLLLINVGRYKILEALNVYRESLTEDDNLLIYYAGHGWLDEENDRGYWLPVDAEPYPYTTNWISTVDVTDIVNSMKAKHVLIIADSSYAVVLTDARPALVELPHLLERSPVDYADWLRLMANQPARLAMTSGSLEPVPDGTGGLHSVFAGALLESLGTNDDILAATRLFIRVAARVSEAARQLGRTQNPTLRLIGTTKYQGGDFFFVPAADSLG